MTRSILILVVCIVVTFSNCTNTASESKEDSTVIVQVPDTSTSLPVPDYDYDEDSVNTTAISKEISTYDYLLGKWQSVDDTSNYLVFDNDLRREIAGGMTEWEEEKFVLSDGCMNASNKEPNSTLGEDRYISCIKSDMCWYIISVDDETLSLSYVGRGNTLTYKRVDDL